MLYPLFFVGVYLSHFRLLRLPYFWDEAGYYIPAAWDFFRLGTLIPQTTVTNGHPPLPSILLAAWWHLSGYVISGTRTLVCMVAAAALLGVFKLAKNLTNTAVAAVTVILTAIYPVWYAQSTLAHADIFAAAFTLWGLSFYLDRTESKNTRNIFVAALMFSLAALSKETAVVTPAALALWEAILLIRDHREPIMRRLHSVWLVVLLVPILPLAAWFAYHYHQTGFVFRLHLGACRTVSQGVDQRQGFFAMLFRFFHLLVQLFGIAGRTAAFRTCSSRRWMHRDTPERLAT